MYRTWARWFSYINFYLYNNPGRQVLLSETCKLINWELEAKFFTHWAYHKYLRQRSEPNQASCKVGAFCKIPTVFRNPTEPKIFRSHFSVLKMKDVYRLDSRYTNIWLLVDSISAQLSPHHLKFCTANQERCKKMKEPSLSPSSFKIPGGILNSFVYSNDPSSPSPQKWLLFYSSINSRNRSKSNT